MFPPIFASCSSAIHPVRLTYWFFKRKRNRFSHAFQVQRELRLKAEEQEKAKVTLTVKSCAQSTKSGLATWQNLYEAKVVPAKFAEIGASDFVSYAFYKMYSNLQNSILFCIQNLYRVFLKGLHNIHPLFDLPLHPFLGLLRGWLAHGGRIQVCLEYKNENMVKLFKLFFEFENFQTLSGFQKLGTFWSLLGIFCDV